MGRFAASVGPFRRASMPGGASAAVSEAPRSGPRPSRPIGWTSGDGSGARGLRRGSAAEANYEEPTGSPALRHSVAIVCAAWGANAPGLRAEAHVDFATVPHWCTCSAPVAAGIVAYMQPDLELGPLEVNEITSTTTRAATTASTPPIIHFSRVDVGQRSRVASACPGGMISTALSVGTAAVCHDRIR